MWEVPCSQCSPCKQRANAVFGATAYKQFVQGTHGAVSTRLLLLKGRPTHQCVEMQRMSQHPDVDYTTHTGPAQAKPSTGTSGKFRPCYAVPAPSHFKICCGVTGRRPINLSVPHNGQKGSTSVSCTLSRGAVTCNRCALSMASSAQGYGGIHALVNSATVAVTEQH